MTGKVDMPSSPTRAEAMAKDSPAFPPIKKEAFDEDSRIKPDILNRFMSAPRLTRKKGTTLRDDEPGETLAYDTYDVIDILEDRHKLRRDF